VFVRSFWLCSTVCLMVYACGPDSRFAPRKADPTKGTVTGTVMCVDTGKPARFATVELLPSPEHPKSDNGPSEESTVTDLDGKFKIEAVTPGDYYAFAVLDGYLNPIYGVDFDPSKPESDDQEDEELIEQWKDHMVAVSVSAQRTSDLPISIERGGEVAGTVAYDDGSPAIGMRFVLYRKQARGDWALVAGGSASGFSLREQSDAHGRFSISNLPSGEYVICALLPGDNQAGSPQLCLGDVPRRRDARTVAVSAGEVTTDADIAIPLSAIHSVEGSISQAITGEPPTKARLHLLYRDDREEALAVDMFSDGSFLFPFVFQGDYILEVSDAVYSETKNTPQGADGSARVSPKDYLLANREAALTVDGNLTDIKVPLVEAPAPRGKN